MSIVLLTVVLSVGQVQHFEARRSPLDLAQIPAPYPADMVDSNRRPGFNGRLWVSRPRMGGLEVWARDSGSPGAEAYGAFGLEDASFTARIDGLFKHTPVLAFEISPWQHIDAHDPSPYSNPYSRATRIVAGRLEEQRQKWLRDQGFTDGVRTFMNDATVWGVHAGEEAEARIPEPAATIQLPPDMPRNKGRLRVDAEPAAAPAPETLRAARVSLPPGAPAQVADRIKANGGTLAPASSELAGK